MEPETVYSEDLGKAKLGETNNGVSQNVDQQSTPSNPDQSRGCGLFGTDEKRVKGDIDMIRSAVARHARFPIPDHIRRDAATWLAEVASSKRYDGRARVNAVKALADLDRLNMEEELRAAGGARVNIDVTSGGKPIIPDVKQLTEEQLKERIRALEGG